MEHYIPVYVGGAVITRNSIVTVGHGLCIDAFRVYISPGKSYLVTCPRNIMEKDMNVNKQGKNEINIKVGNNLLEAFRVTFDNSIEAYLYNLSLIHI